MIYGYCRISTKKQNIERQIRNIQKAYPTADIRQEVFTGTKSEGRKVFEQLLKIVRSGDTLVFDSVSRMSRNAEIGFEVYQELYDKGVELNNIELTGTKTDIILKAINEYLMELAKEQIQLAFEQSEKEVSDLHQRTKEGIETARKNGKQIGQKSGTVLTTKKSIAVKQGILKYSRDFGGSLTDAECMKLLGIAKNTYYKYKAQLKDGA